MSNTRSQLIDLVQQNALASTQVEPAAVVSGVFPPAPAWRTFLDRTLLVLGGLSLSTALVFFIAYNWFEFGRFAKFTLAQSAILLAIIGYVLAEKHKKPTLVGQTCLLVASIALGALLALYGQTYQTGADPWQLFFYWALLMLPWVLISRFSWLWLVWCALLNLSLMLYLDEFRAPSFLHSNSSIAMLTCSAILNVGFLIVWEVFSKRFKWLQNRGAKRLLLVVTMWAITTIAIEAIYDSNARAIFKTALCVLATLFGGAYYRWKNPDLFALAVMVLSLSALSLMQLAELVFSGSSDWLSGLFFMVIGTLAIGASATVWLKNVNHEFNDHNLNNKEANA